MNVKGVSGYSQSTDVGLSDAIIALRILAGISVTETGNLKDINGDGKIGMEEAVYILQYVAGLRP